MGDLLACPRPRWDSGLSRPPAGDPGGSVVARMPTSTRQSGVLSWLVVVMVGVLILLVVFGLALFTRRSSRSCPSASTTSLP